MHKLNTISALILVVVLAAVLAPAVASADPLSGNSSSSNLLSEGRVDEAIVALESRVSRSPNDAESYNLLCRAYYTLGNWDRGIAACEKAVSLDSGNSQYHLWLGRVYGEKADHSHFVTAAALARKVRSEFETAVRLNPNNAAARTDLAEFYTEAPGIVGGGKDKAEAQAQELIALDPVKAGWIRARLDEKAKDMAGAENAYLAAIQMSHGRADAWVNLARFYRSTGRPQEMEDAIQHVTSAPLNQPSVLMDAAQVLIHAGRNTALATQLLRRYLASSASVEDAPAFKAHYLLGNLLEQQGDKQAAAKEYQTSLSLAKSFTLAQTALNRL